VLLGLAVVLGAVGVYVAYTFGGQGSSGVLGPLGAAGSSKLENKGVTFGITPADNTADVAPSSPVVVNAANGKITSIALTSPEGRAVEGQLMSGDTRWVSNATLGYGQTYVLDVKGIGPEGKESAVRSTFTTIKPATQVYVGMNPLDGQAIGIGQPLAFYFDKAITNKQATQDAIRITTSPVAEGAFRWFSNKEVHWRPRDYWKPGTKVEVAVNVFGKDLGDGVYGKEDRKAAFTIGDSVIARADGQSHQMTVEVNGELVRTIPVALGRAQFPSNNGVHVVTEKVPSKIMDSTTYGLSLDSGGYRTEVKWATRISNGGEFLHAAPWSVRDQGRRNVSHGCVNMSTENAQFMFNLLKKGDVIILANTGGPDLAVWDGFGDWQIPWEQWVEDDQG
jgi:lipoprotein-anchoring transpeptidase ErfK/SrfK